MAAFLLPHCTVTLYSTIQPLCTALYSHSVQHCTATLYSSFNWGQAKKAGNY
jgi:hypothetical protein